MCSPFFLQTEAVRDFYSDHLVLRPGAVSVDANPGGEHLRDEEIHFRLYEVEHLVREAKRP
jgi:hypothetical protein